MILEKKKFGQKKFFWLGFQGKILHHNEHVLDKLREKLEKVALGGLNISVGLPEVSENVSLTQNTI